MENWATEKEYLDLWAIHYQTGEKIPAELVQKGDRCKELSGCLSAHSSGVVWIDRYGLVYGDRSGYGGCGPF